MSAKRKIEIEDKNEEKGHLTKKSKDEKERLSLLTNSPKVELSPSQSKEQEWTMGLAHIVKAFEDYVCRSQEDFPDKPSDSMYKMMCELHKSVVCSQKALNEFLQPTLQSKICFRCLEYCNDVFAYLHMPPLCKKCNEKDFTDAYEKGLRPYLTKYQTP